MRIRPYRQDDWNAVREMYDLSKPDEMRGAVPLESIPTLDRSPEMLLLFHESNILVTEDSGVVTGFAGHHGGYISFLVVHPQHRRKRVASALLRRLLETLDGPVSLSVVFQNAAARTLYVRFGFQIERDFVGKFHAHDVRILRMVRAETESRHGLVTVPYTPAIGLELVRMWRASFERALDIVDPHPIEDQLAYLEKVVVPSHDIQILIEPSTSAVRAFMASTPDTIAQLYVDIGSQGRGIGSMLVERAKSASSGRLRLFTFEKNRRAQEFYERRGFQVIARGFEPRWHLADIQYEWIAER